MSLGAVWSLSLALWSPFSNCLVWFPAEIDDFSPSYMGSQQIEKLMKNSLKSSKIY